MKVAIRKRRFFSAAKSWVCKIWVQVLKEEKLKTLHNYINYLFHMIRMWHWSRCSLVAYYTCLYMLQAWRSSDVPGRGGGAWDGGEGIPLVGYDVGITSTLPDLFLSSSESPIPPCIPCISHILFNCQAYVCIIEIRMSHLYIGAANIYAFVLHV